MIATLSSSSMSLAPAGSVLDEVGLLARIKGDMTFLGIIFEAFQSQYPGQRADMRTALTANDFEKVRTIAHSLKGNASTLGGQRVAGVAAEIMASSALGEATGVHDMFRRLDAEVALFQKAMSHLLHG